MTQLFGKAFTQLLNLNILDELRIKGVLVNPGALGPGIVLPNQSGVVEQDFEDFFVSFTAPGTYNLLAAIDADRPVTIKCELGAGGNVTVSPDGTETIEGVAADRTVTPGTSITIAPITGGWSEG